MLNEHSNIPMMPDEYRGGLRHIAGGNKDVQRAWSEKEVEWLKKMIKDGYSRKEIAYSMGRTDASIQLKQKRLGKKNNTYNSHHVEEKYAVNKEFVEYVKPRKILDLYAGNSFYKSIGCEVVTNDINKNIDADYHEDALRLICKLYSQKNSYDMIDLDPFGSAYDSFNLAIKMAKKAIVITFGELGHKRWKRYDFVREHYGICDEEDFTLDNLIKEVQRIGRMNKKNLVLWKSCEWQQIGRAWFTIEPIKVTEQWGE